MFRTKLAGTLAILAALAAFSFSAVADVDSETYGESVAAFDATSLASGDMLPALPASMTVSAAQTVATYAMNDIPNGDGVTWFYKDFRTIADSGGALA